MVTRMGGREISVVSGRVGMYAVFSLDSGFKIQSWFKIHVSARKRKKDPDKSPPVKTLLWFLYCKKLYDLFLQ